VSAPRVSMALLAALLRAVGLFGGRCMLDVIDPVFKYTTSMLGFVECLSHCSCGGSSSLSSNLIGS
jgi:hypothetical protein